MSIENLLKSQIREMKRNVEKEYFNNHELEKQIQEGIKFINLRIDSIKEYEKLLLELGFELREYKPMHQDFPLDYFD